MKLFVKREDKLRRDLKRMLASSKAVLADLEKKAKKNKKAGYYKLSDAEKHTREKYRFLASRLEILDGNS